jgi:hypothetical protein
MAEMRYKLTDYPYPTTSIWNEDWDLLVILDACRTEWMMGVADDYDFIDNVDTIHSVGSHSKEWITKTFDDKYSQTLSDTIYITGNHYADNLDESKLEAFETAHNYGGWAYDSASPPANVITDLAVQAARNNNWERCVVHYMQPHKPFFTKTESRGDFSVQEWSLGYQPYREFFSGNITREQLNTSFQSNLNYVLNEVELLLENVDASDVVLTADHGQALGENGLWDHTIGVKHPSMRRVPWVETTASDEHTLDPDDYDKSQYDEELVESNLRDLGYM